MCARKYDASDPHTIHIHGDGTKKTVTHLPERPSGIIRALLVVC